MISLRKSPNKLRLESSLRAISDLCSGPAHAAPSNVAGADSVAMISLGKTPEKRVLESSIRDILERDAALRRGLSTPARAWRDPALELPVFARFAWAKPGWHWGLEAQFSRSTVRKPV
jgi:hypothetical protein